MAVTTNPVSAASRTLRHARADPRTVIAPCADGWRLIGGRCTACGHPSPTNAPRCPRCGSRVTAATFGPSGVVWSTTTIHIAHGERSEPYTLAYVDLDDGPRLLAHVIDGRQVAIGDRIGLREHSPLGDPQVEVIP